MTIFFQTLLSSVNLLVIALVVTVVVIVNFVFLVSFVVFVEVLLEVLVVPVVCLSSQPNIVFRVSIDF